MKTHMKFLLCYLALSLFYPAHAASSRDDFYSKLSQENRNKISSQELDSLLSKTDLKYTVVISSIGANTINSVNETVSSVKNKVSNSKKNIIKIKNSKKFKKFVDYSMFPVISITSDIDGLLDILSHPDVAAVYEDKIYYANLAESLPLINQPITASQNHIGSGTSIAILDTGVNYTHSTFGSCSFVNSTGCKVAYAGDFAPNDGEMDNHGHGTNVAAIASSVAPGAKILALDIFTKNGLDHYVEAASALAAMEWVVANKDTYNIKVMNNSWGNDTLNQSACSSNYSTVISTAKSIGIAVVFSAGNNKFINGVNSPSCSADVVRVGAVYDSNRGYSIFSNCTDPSTYADLVTCFSNSSPMITLLAPGSEIAAGGYNFSGTSQAAPHVAGAIAVMKAADVAPGDTVDQTVARLVNTGFPVTDARNGVTKPRLDLAAAVNNAIGSISVGGPSPVSPTSSATVNTTTPTLTWTAKPGTTQYVITAWDAAHGANSFIYVAVGANSANCNATTCSYSFANVPFSNGAASWSVRADAPVSTSDSARAYFNVDTSVQPPPSSSTPNPVSPINSATVTVTTPILTWTAKSGTTQYVITAWDAAHGAQATLIYRAVLASSACNATTCSYSFTDVPFSNGVASWRVRADAPASTPDSAKAYFNVDSGGGSVVSTIPNTCQQGNAPVNFGEVTAGAPICLQNISGKSQLHINVPSNMTGKTIRIRTAHGSGDGSILFKQNNRPSLPSTYDYASNDAGVQDTLSVPNVQTGWNYIHFETISSFSGVTLLVEYIN